MVNLYSTLQDSKARPMLVWYWWKSDGSWTVSDLDVFDSSLFSGHEIHPLQMEKSFDSDSKQNLWILTEHVNELSEVSFCVAKVEEKTIVAHYECVDVPATYSVVSGDGEVSLVVEDGEYWIRLEFDDP